jgi:hypothetical protein
MDSINVSPKEARELWVQALRSGKYQQGKGALHPEDLFCCLGVACEVFMQNGGKLILETHLGDNGGKEISYNGHDDSLPRQVMAWLGLTSTIGDIISSSDSLADINDRGTPFSEIADLIEQGKVEVIS